MLIDTPDCVHSCERRATLKAAKLAAIQVQAVEEEGVANNVIGGAEADVTMAE